MVVVTLEDAPVSSSVFLAVAPVFLGSLASWLLGGVSVVQLYIYYTTFPNDRAMIRAIVFLIFALDLFQTVVGGFMGWHLMVSGWGRQSQLIQPGWTFSGLSGVDGIMAFIVQTFYAWRIWVLKKWLVIPGIIVVVSLASLLGAWLIAFGIIGLQDVAGLHPFFPKTIVWLGGGSCADIIIAVCMVFILLRARRNTNALNRSSEVIDRLITLSVETGALTALCAIVQLILFLSSQTTNLHLFFALILGKLYANSLYTSLNARLVQRNTRNSSASTRLSSVEFNSSLRRGDPRATAGASSGPVVHVQTQQEFFVEQGAFSAPDGKNDVEMMGFDNDSMKHAEDFQYTTDRPLHP